MASTDHAQDYRVYLRDKLWEKEFCCVLSPPKEPTIGEICSSIRRIIEEDDDRVETSKHQSTCSNCNVLKAKISGLEVEIVALRKLLK